MNNERYKQLMNDVGLPNSLSLLTALRQVENEVSQPLLAENKRLRAALQDVLAEYAFGGCAPDASSNCRTCRALVAITRALEQKP